MITQAIVIKKENTNEYDQWVTCYTEEFGKLKTIAKSILKPSSVQALHLDIFNLAEFELINGRGMPIITGAQAVSSYPGIKNSLAKTAAAYFFAEVIDKMVFENNKDEELWSFLVAFFNELDKCEHNQSSPAYRQAGYAYRQEGKWLPEYPEFQEGSSALISLFREGQKKLLDILGYLPETDSCKACSDKLDGENFGAFNHVLGGVVCKRCFLSGHGGILRSNGDRERLNTMATSARGRSILDGMFEYISGGKFYSLELLNMVKY